MCDSDKLLASVERQEYKRIERPRGAFSRQLFVDEAVGELVSKMMMAVVV